VLLRRFLETIDLLNQGVSHQLRLRDTVLTADLVELGVKFVAEEDREYPPLLFPDPFGVLLPEP